MALGGSCGAEGMQQGLWAGRRRGTLKSLGFRVPGITVFAPFFRVVSDNCYPFAGREQNEASTTPRCMMHSRAMGRGKRQATSRCPNSQVDSNDIYQVTPAYRLGSDVRLK